MSATALRNRFDPNGHEEREEQYERTRERYSEAQWTRFAEALGAVTIELVTEPRDVLGEVYMQLEIASRDQGQFFTPYSVCQLMAALQVPDAAEQLQTRPFLTVYEPACGAGAMVIAVAQELTSQGVDCSTQLHVTADDLSTTAVAMSYIQLSLLQIPAIVNHRNSLTLEHFDAWPTAAHALGGWDRKLSMPLAG
ncbi:N-6 DNA methylase [Microbacterium sp. ZOR0019]|uniref:N-6 DNA methylase n=1 Tax=Microbacterium sp. ZOR0019 TaxID=1339233 RepID=UPI001E3677E3|nr:N-6 DNA methylase [Microbacterium sp. ZOR0019]